MLITIGRDGGKDTKDLSSNSLIHLWERLQGEPFYNEKLITACDEELKYRAKNNFGGD